MDRIQAGEDAANDLPQHKALAGPKSETIARNLDVEVSEVEEAFEVDTYSEYQAH
jgi:hypothetical protein